MDDDAGEARCTLESCAHVRSNLKSLLQETRKRTEELKNFQKIKSEVEVLRMKLASADGTLSEHTNRTIEAVNAKEIAEASLKQVNADSEFLRKQNASLKEQADDSEKHKEQANHWRLKYDEMCSLAERLEGNNIDIKSKYESTVKTMELVGKKTLSYQNQVTQLKAAKNDWTQKSKKLDKYLKSAIQVIDSLSTTTNLSKQPKPIADLVNVFRRDDVRLFFNATPWTMSSGSSMPNVADVSDDVIDNIGRDEEPSASSVQADFPVDDLRLDTGRTLSDDDDDDVDKVPEDERVDERKIRILEEELTRQVTKNKRKPDFNNKMRELNARKNAPRVIEVKNLGDAAWPRGCRKPMTTDTDFNAISHAAEQRKKALLGVSEGGAVGGGGGATLSSAGASGGTIHGKKGKTVREQQSEMMKKESVKEKVARMKAEAEEKKKNNTATSSSSSTSAAAPPVKSEKPEKPAEEVAVPVVAPVANDLPGSLSISRTRHQSFMMSEKDSDDDDSDGAAAAPTPSSSSSAAPPPIRPRGRPRSRSCAPVVDDPITPVKRENSRRRLSRRESTSSSVATVPTTPIRRSSKLVPEVVAPEVVVPRGRGRPRKVTTTTSRTTSSIRSSPTPSTSSVRSERYRTRSVRQSAISSPPPAKRTRSRASSRCPSPAPSTSSTRSERYRTRSVIRGETDSSPPPPPRTPRRRICISESDDDEDDLQMSPQKPQKSQEKAGDIMKQRLQEAQKQQKKRPAPVPMSAGPPPRTRRMEKMKAPIIVKKTNVKKEEEGDAEGFGDISSSSNESMQKEEDSVEVAPREASPELVRPPGGSEEAPGASAAPADIPAEVPMVLEFPVARKKTQKEEEEEDSDYLEREIVFEDIMHEEILSEDSDDAAAYGAPRRSPVIIDLEDDEPDIVVVENPTTSSATSSAPVFRPMTPKSPKQIMVSKYGLDISDSEEEQEEEEQDDLMLITEKATSLNNTPKYVDETSEPIRQVPPVATSSEAAPQKTAQHPMMISLSSEDSTSGSEEPARATSPKLEPPLKATSSDKPVQAPPTFEIVEAPKTSENSDYEASKSSEAPPISLESPEIAPITSKPTSSEEVQVQPEMRSPLKATSPEKTPPTSEIASAPMASETPPTLDSTTPEVDLRPQAPRIAPVPAKSTSQPKIEPILESTSSKVQTLPKTDMVNEPEEAPTTTIPTRSTSSKVEAPPTLIQFKSPEKAPKTQAPPLIPTLTRSSSSSSSSTSSSSRPKLEIRDSQDDLIDDILSGAHTSSKKPAAPVTRSRKSVTKQAPPISKAPSTSAAPPREPEDNEEQDLTLEVPKPIAPPTSAPSKEKPAVPVLPKRKTPLISTTEPTEPNLPKRRIAHPRATESRQAPPTTRTVPAPKQESDDILNDILSGAKTSQKRAATPDESAPKRQYTKKTPGIQLIGALPLKRVRLGPKPTQTASPQEPSTSCATTSEPIVTPDDPSTEAPSTPEAVEIEAIPEVKEVKGGPKKAIVIDAPRRPRGKSVRQEQKPMGMKEAMEKQAARGGKQVEKNKTHLRQALDLKVGIKELSRPMEEKGIRLGTSIDLTPSDAVDVMMEFLRESSAADMWAVLIRQRTNGNLAPLVNTEEENFLQVSASLNENDAILLDLFIRRILYEISLRDSIDAKQCGRLVRLFCHAIKFAQHIPSSPDETTDPDEVAVMLHEKKSTWMRCLFMALFHKHPIQLVKSFAYCLISEVSEYCRFLVDELEGDPKTSEYHVAFRIMMHKDAEQASVMNWLLNSKFQMANLVKLPSDVITNACNVAHQNFIDDVEDIRKSMFLARTGAHEMLSVAFDLLKTQMELIKNQFLEPKDKDKELKHRTVFSVPAVATKMTASDADIFRKEIEWQKTVLLVMIDNPTSSNYNEIMKALIKISPEVVSFREIVDTSEVDQFVEPGSEHFLSDAVQNLVDIISDFTNFPLRPSTLPTTSASSFVDDNTPSTSS